MTRAFAAPVVRMLLLVWIGFSSFTSHPDYLSYFNEIPQHPAYTLAESDLDWGQDLQRLSLNLKTLRPLCTDWSSAAANDRPNRWYLCKPDGKEDPFYLNYFGSADPHQFDLPPYQMLQGWQPVKGWIAVSVHVETIEAAALAQTYGIQRGMPGPLDWLTKQYQPVAMAGKSIKIYHVE